MTHAYIEQRDGAYVIAGTRVSLDSVVYAFLDGQSAEAIAQTSTGTLRLAGKTSAPRDRQPGMRTRCSTRSWLTPKGRPRSRAECQSAFRPTRI